MHGETDLGANRYARFVRSAWTGVRGALRANRELLLIAALLFVSTQLFELAELKWTQKGFNYLCNWDCGWFAHVVDEGYDAVANRAPPCNDGANWAFFPAFPLAARFLARLTRLSTPFALVVTSKLCFFLAIFAFIKLSRVYLPKVDPVLAGALVAFNPYSVYANVGYSESLFLFASCCSLYFFKREQYVLSGLAGALTTATRLVGVFLVPALLVAESIRVWREGARPDLGKILGIALIPLGLALFMLFLYLRTGDALAFAHIQKAWNRLPGNPFFYLKLGIVEGGLHRFWSVMVIVSLALGLIMTFSRWCELGIFSLGMTLLPLTTGLWAMPRYIWWEAPLLLCLVAILSFRRLWLVLLPVSICGLAWMYHAWLTGQGFVV